MKRQQFSKIRHHLCQPKSLRTLFIALFIIQSGIFIGLAYLFFNQSKQDIVSNLLTVVTTETSERISTQISQELNTAISLNAINRDVAATTNGTTNYNALIRAAVIQLHNFPKISAIGASQVGGYSLRVNRYNTIPNHYDVELISPERPDELQIFRVNLAGKKLADIGKVQPFRLTDWPWYKSIQNVQPNSWSRPHMTRDGSNLVISTYVPIYPTDARNPPTLFVSSISLQKINELLEAQQFKTDSLAVVTELDGTLIGTSTNENPYFLVKGINQAGFAIKRIHVQESSHALIASLTPLLPQAKGLKPGESRLQSLMFGGSRYYVSIERLDFDPSLDWVLLTVISEATLTKDIHASLIPTLVLLGVLFILIVVLNLLTAQAIIRPIKALKKQTENLLESQPLPQAPPQFIKELKDLNLAFEEMARRIQENFTQLQSEQAHLAQILDVLPVGVAIHAPNGQLSYINPTGMEFLGLEQPPDFHGMTQLNQDFHLYQAGTDQPYPPEQLPAVQALAGKTAEMDDVEVRIGETKRVLKVRSTPIYNPDGEIKAGLVAFVDISDRKQVEQILENYNATLSREITERTLALQKSEERFRFALQSTETSWWDWDVKTNAVEWSENFDQMVGRPPNTYPKNAASFLSFLHPDDVEPTRTKLFDSIENGTPYKTEFRFVHPDGTIRWIMATGTVQRDENGQATRMSGINLNITERKQIEEALQNSEERLRLSLSYAGTSWWDWDVVNNTIQWSDNFYAMVGRTPEDCPPHVEAFIEFIHPEDRERVGNAIQASLEQDVPYRVEFRLLHPDGTIYWVMATGIVQRDPTGRPIRMSGINLDINERKQIEADLQTSEQRLRMAMESTATNWWEWDLIRNQSDWSDQVMGHIPDDSEKNQDTFYKLLHPDDRERVKAGVELALATGEPYQGEFRLLQADGSYVWILGTGNVEYNADGQPIRMSGLNVNITPLKEVQLALAEREAMMQALFDQASQFTALLTPQGKVVKVNQRALDFIGLSDEAIVDQDFWDTAWWQVSEQIQTELKSAIEQASQGIPIRYDVENQGNHGQRIIVDFSIRPIYDSEHRIIFLLCEGRDITDKFRMQQALQESEERFRQTFQTTAVSSALISLDGKFLEVNPAFCELLGYTPTELIDRDMAEVTDPNSVPFREGLTQELLSREIMAYTQERRYQHRDGHWVWGLLNVSLVRDDQQQPLYYVCQIQNIDPLKQAQEKLEQVNTELERLTQIDGLTGVYNRRFFDQALEREWQIAFRESESLTLLMLDIDYFKLYNDTLGHQAGDHCLRIVAAVLQESVHRISDLVARYGGEEFALILPRTDLPGALVIAERIQTLLAAKAIPHPTSHVSNHLTVSIGIHAAVPRPGLPLRSWVKCADDALYQAKQRGRNRYIVSGPEASA